MIKNVKKKERVLHLSDTFVDITGATKPDEKIKKGI
jgi:hypothetical protein